MVEPTINIQASPLQKKVDDFNNDPSCNHTILAAEACIDGSGRITLQHKAQKTQKVYTITAEAITNLRDLDSGGLDNDIAGKALRLLSNDFSQSKSTLTNNDLETIFKKHLEQQGGQPSQSDSNDDSAGPSGSGASAGPSGSGAPAAQQKEAMERLLMAHEEQQGRYTKQLAALEALHRQHIANLQVEFGRQRGLLENTLHAIEAGHADRMHHYEQQLDARQAAHEQQMTQLNAQFQVQLQQLTTENRDHIASLERKITELTDLQQRSQEQIPGLIAALEGHTAAATDQLQLQQQQVERLERLVLASQEQIVALIGTLEDERATLAATQQNMEAATEALTGATAALPPAVAALTAATAALPEAVAALAAATAELRAAVVAAAPPAPGEGGGGANIGNGAIDALTRQIIALERSIEQLQRSIGQPSSGGGAAALGAAASISMIYERLDNISEQMEAMSNAYAASCLSTIQGSAQQLDELTKMGETIISDIEKL